MSRLRSPAARRFNRLPAPRVADGRIASPALGKVCARLVERARAHFAQAGEIMARSPRRTVRAPRIMGEAYRLILDSLVDQRSDTARGERVFVRLFADERELGEHLHSLIAEALVRAREAPRANHHVMTLAGSVAFYTTHQGARDPRVRRLSATVRSDLSPTIWPAVAVMRTWRVAKSISSLACRHSTRPKGRRSCMRRRVEG